MERDACLDAVTTECDCRTTGPASARLKSSASATAMPLVSAVSLATAVTNSVEPTRRESDAFAVARLFAAVRIASFALPTWIEERSESERVAAPAFTRVTAARSCCSACSSCLRAALSDSRAASTAKYCCFTLSATVKDDVISAASAASTLACAARKLK